MDLQVPTGGIHLLPITIPVHPSCGEGLTIPHFLLVIITALYLV
jgi:hypothetical protein